jgi:hypothetical protein
VYKSIYIAIGLLSMLACNTPQHSIVNMQSKALYDVSNEAENVNSINGFKATTIFADNYDNTIWVSKENNCVQLQLESEQTYTGKHALHLKWDKPNGGCKWIGIGFGWNNWLAKDISDIVNDAHIEMYVKAVNDSLSNLPVAFAIEDYTGVQSYYGFTKALVTGAFTNTQWRKVSIPLSYFPFIKNDADLAKIKQFIIQLEGDGDIYLDEIKIVANEAK